MNTRFIRSVLGAEVLSLPQEHPVVDARTYAFADCGAGGITEESVMPDDMRPLGACSAGAEVYYRTDESLDDTNEETEAATRVWLKGLVLDHRAIS
jgi:hypothetical protein